MIRRLAATISVARWIVITLGVASVCGWPGWANAGFADYLGRVTGSDAVYQDRFGGSVAIDGNSAVIGAYTHQHIRGNIGKLSGAAYVFDVGSRQEQLEYVPTDFDTGDNIGFSVAVSGNVAIVGAYLSDDAGTQSGSAYLFDTTTGQELFKLTADDAKANDQFGVSVGIAGGYAVVGSLDAQGDASGAVYVYDVATGQQLRKIVPDDALGGDFFGQAVAIDGTTLVVGALWDNDAGDESGSAYVFDVATGQQLRKLVAEDGAAGDRFGTAVAVDGNTAIIGANMDRVDGIQTGSAYLFNLTTGVQLHKLLASDAGAGDLFGDAVDVEGELAIVGASRHKDSGVLTGGAYLFDLSSGQELAKLAAPDGMPVDFFGDAVAIGTSAAIVGAMFQDSAGLDAGAAFFYSVVPEPNSLTTIVLFGSTWLPVRMRRRGSSRGARRGASGGDLNASRKRRG